MWGEGVVEMRCCISVFDYECVLVEKKPTSLLSMLIKWRYFYLRLVLKTAKKIVGLTNKYWFP